MISPSDDSSVSVTLSGSGASICWMAGNTTAALVDPSTAPNSEESSHVMCRVSRTTTATRPTVKA